jgi:hypothetical protein
MATYTDPVAKSWVMGNYEDFAEGTTNGTELESPNYQNKIILECLLGSNKLGPSGKDWNPGFEKESLTIPGTPEHWRFEEPSTRSTYEQESEEAYEGEDYVKLADEGEQGREIHKVGRLILHPEGGNPDELEIDADPEKTFTIRYHGRYENPEEFGFRGPTVNMDVQEDEAKETVKFDPFTEEEEYPQYWARSDFRLPPSEGTPEDRWVQSLRLNFGDTRSGNLGELLHQRWSIDAVSVAETFPAQAEFFANGTYTSPTFATPPTLSKIVWGVFNAVTDTPEGTSLEFEIRGYDWGTREWSPWVPIAPGQNIQTFVSTGSARATSVENWTRIQWRARLECAAEPATVTPYVDSVTVNYTEQFRTDHPRIWLESDDIPVIVAKIENHTQPGDTNEEYAELLERADQIFDDPPPLSDFGDPPDYKPAQMIKKYYNIVNGASFVYLLGIEEEPPHNAEDYAPRAAAWVEYLLDNHPFFNEDGTVEYNIGFWGGPALSKSPRHNRLSQMLAVFRDWCHDYLADPARAELKAKVEKTLMQVSYYALYDRRPYLFNPNNKYRYVWNNAAFPLFALWDNADVYDQTYAYLSNWPFLPPRQLMEEGEDKHVEDLLAYYSEHFHDGTNPEGAGYGGGHVRWFAIFYKAWKTALYENWFTKTDLIRNMALHELYRLQPDCTWERIAVTDASGAMYSREASERLANLGSEYDGDGDIGPVFRYMTEDILKWWPTSASEATELINRILWRDSGGSKVNPAAANLPTARVFPCRGDVFMRSAWEFDPATAYGAPGGYYNGFPSGTDTTAVFVAFKSGPAITGHNHCDQNTFTIFSRGNLAVDTGTTPGGEDHHRNYFVRTVAHNAILIYDPDEEYPHVPKGYEDAPEPLANDGGQIYYQYEDELLRAIKVNYAYFFKHKRTGDAGRIERFETQGEYDYFYGVADVAYNAYDYVDDITYQKCWWATREIVMVKPFGEYVPEPNGDTEFPYFVVVYDEVSSLWNAPPEGATTKWVVHAVDKPEVKTEVGWQSPAAPTSGWEPEGDLGVFRFNARQDVPTYPGRLFGIMLLPAAQARSVKVLGGKDETNDYRFYVDGTNYPPNPPQEAHITEGEWRIEIEPLTDAALHKFLHVLWPTNLETASEAITCDLLTQVAEYPWFNGAFIRPQDGEHGGTLHHVIGFVDDRVDASAYAYDVNLETHTNHVICRLLYPNVRCQVTVENLDTHETEVFEVVTTTAHVLRFDSDPVGAAGPHRVKIEYLGG